MKNTMILVLTLSLILTSTPVFAADTDGFIILMDIVIARPFGLASLAVGSAIFVVTLPFAALSKSTKQTADTLVVDPFRFTFVRPPGDFSESYMAYQHEKLTESQQEGKDITDKE